MDVGAATGLTPGSVTALLDRLQARELVRRTRPESNKRVLSVEATAAGRRLLAAVLDPVREAVVRVLAADDPATAEVLRRNFATLAAELENVRVPPFTPP